MLQLSRYLSASASCAIALCIACGRAETRPMTHDAREQPAGASSAPLVTPPLTAAVAPEPPASEDGAGDEGRSEADGAAPGSPGAMPVLNQLLTTQALIVSLLLTPLSKAPELPPNTNEPAPLGNGSATEPSSVPRPSVQKLMQRRAPFGAAS